MANTVKLKRSAVQGKVPATSDLELGELALNTNDGVLFFKRDNGSESVVKVATTTNLLSYTRVTSNTTAVTRQSYIADTSGGTFTITLPESPVTGDWVTIVDGASFQTTALTVGRNSSTIADTAENLSLNIEGVSVTLVYDGSTWEVYTQVGANGGDQSGLVTGSSTTTFTNKTISGSSNTLSNIANASLTNSSVTVNGTSISLGGSGTVTAAAGTLTGTELKSTVVTSSLTSVGTLTNLNVTNPITINSKQAVNGPAFRAYIATGQAITSGSQQKVTFGSETFDTNSNFASSRFTPTVEGYYQLNSTVRIAGASSTAEYMITIWKNGSEYARGTNASGTEQGSNFYSMQVSDIAYANGSTDYFEIYIQQGSGSNKDTTAGSNISFFSGCMIRGA